MTNKTKVSHRELVMMALKGSINPIAASVLVKMIKKIYKRDVKLSSISSLLNKMWLEGELLKWPDRGPRGGSGFTVKRENP